jgi:cysteine desulfurase/selenocysteine lyase
MAIDVKALDCDFLAFSAHKMFGPTGIGILYGKAHLLNAMEPLEYGGDMNDNVDAYDGTWKESPYKFETGTPPIAEAIGFASAIHYIQSIGIQNIMEHERTLKQKAVKALLEIDGVTVYNKTAETGIITFNFDGVHPHDAVSYFDENNIAMRAGHHCAQLVIKWLGVNATLRATFYAYNTESDVDSFIENVKNARQFFSDVGF